MKVPNLIQVGCMLAVLSSGLQAQRNETTNQRRTIVSPEETIINAWLEQGDQDGDEQLNHSEWDELIDRWSDRLHLEGIDRMSQAEFLNSMPTLVTDGKAGRQTASRRMLPNRFLGFFVALDENQDGYLTSQEFLKQSTDWFKDWSHQADSDHLDADALLEGIRKILPKTNMSGANGLEPQVLHKQLPSPPPSPVLSPTESLNTIQVAAPFKMKLAASEPMIQEPVAMSFDANGACYVVEMRSFMLDVDRTGERDPIGRISKLVDLDGDGVMDRSTVFMDGLIVPRAVLATHDGILFVEDYTLQFAQDTDGNGHADIRLLVDPNYGRSNIEHAPNGLMLAMDNWIYNGRSPWRYRLINGKWVKEQTELRGQWGMTQDLHGRLLYNVNNSQLLGDIVPPNVMGRNQNYPSTAGLNLFIATDQTVYTARMNTAVNRGYLPDVLDDRGRLHVFASSCSPLIYRGDQLGPGLVGDAFVCDPAANIVKRNQVMEKPLNLTSRQAYTDKEFIAATDERFRPVNLYNGPDGALWLLDMYRGIAQYGMFMTDYLRKESIDRGLDKGIHLGRLYRITHPNRPIRRPTPMSNKQTHELVAYLDHADGWMRDTAQRLLVERRDRSVVPQLQRLIETSGNPVGMEHALWTLEGLLMSLKQNVSTPYATSLVKEIASEQDLTTHTFPENVWQTILQATQHTEPHVQVAAMRVAESLCRDAPERSASLLEQLTAVSNSSNRNVILQAALTAGSLPQPNSLPLMSELATRHADAYLIREAIMSGLQDWELSFLQLLFSRLDWKEQQPGYLPFCQSLSEAITASGHATQLELLLDLAANQSGEYAWRTHVVLTGMRNQLIASGKGAFILNRKPAAWSVLTEQSPTEIQTIAKEITDYLVWPGHPQYASAIRSAEQRKEREQANDAPTQGEQLYQMICAGCHGASGEGMKAQAPPLRGSEWTQGSKERLVRIVLQGAQGPIHVGGRLYEPPDILAEMPPVAALEDEPLAAILTFIRQAWDHNAEPIHASEITNIRHQTKDRQNPWTESELLAIP